MAAPDAPPTFAAAIKTAAPDAPLINAAEHEGRCFLLMRTWARLPQLQQGQVPAFGMNVASTALLLVGDPEPAEVHQQGAGGMVTPAPSACQVVSKVLRCALEAALRYANQLDGHFGHRPWRPLQFPQTALCPSELNVAVACPRPCFGRAALRTVAEPVKVSEHHHLREDVAPFAAKAPCAPLATGHPLAPGGGRHAPTAMEVLAT